MTCGSATGILQSGNGSLPIPKSESRSWILSSGGSMRTTFRASSPMNAFRSSLRKEVELEESKSADVDRFLSVVERYTDIPELTPCILHEFVEKNHRPCGQRPEGQEPDTGDRHLLQGYRSLGNVKSHGINGKMRKRYSRSYTVLSFLTMFSYRELPCRSFRFTLCFRSAPTDANPNFDRVCNHCECTHSCGFHQPNTKSRHFA